jgi:two-component system, cell cycle response regulator
MAAHTAACSAQLDWPAGVCDRQALLALLFRETDRAQRQNSPMSLLRFDIDGFSPWNERLGADAGERLLCQVVVRTARLLRSYDLLGSMGINEFLVALPGCWAADAAMLAGRLRLDLFSLPFHLDGEPIRLSACFGIACSRGRSPLVVLREAEEALRCAKTAGPESIQIFGDSLCTALRASSTNS